MNNQSKTLVPIAPLCRFLVDQQRHAMIILTNKKLRVIVAGAISYFSAINIYLNWQLMLTAPNVYRNLFPSVELVHPLSEQTTMVQPLRGKRICVVVGILSRAKESELRNWHRQHFSEITTTVTNIRLTFPVAYNKDYAEFISKENSIHGDVLFLPINESYRWLMANTMEFLRSAVNVFLREKTTDDCDAKFIIKADSDVLINYHRLNEALSSAPAAESLYFGLMQNSYPTESRIVREWAETSHSLLPPWAVGPWYGMSLDVAENLLRVKNTVIFDDGDMIPEEDRGVGIALKRGQVHVQHIMFLKGLYLFCDVEAMSCKELDDYVAVHVGFGISGNKSERIERKRSMLSDLSEHASRCRTRSITQNVTSSYFIPVDRITSMEESLFHNCPRISEEAVALSQQIRADYEQITLDYDLSAIHECAESVYRRNYPEVLDNVTGRQHFLTEGYKEGYAYYCPRKQCMGQTKSPECLECDAERSYLKSYPDVAEAVLKGSIPSAKFHFASYGRHEGRLWSCHSRYQEPGSGTVEGCRDVYGKFVSLTKRVVEKWPISGQAGHSETNKAVVFVEGRPHRWTDYSLRVARRYTGKDWMFYLIGPPAMCKVWREKYQGPMIRIVQLPEEFGDLSQYPDQINRLYKSRFLWEEVLQSEHVLFIQSDALLLRHGVEDFFEFDYVGSPIFSESFPTSDWWYLCTKDHKCGGNGGLSLRKRSSMIDALNRCQTKELPFDEKNIDEDVWFASCMLELGKHMPHPVLANRFSTGSTCSVDAPFGVHKLWQNCRESTCIEVLMGSHLFTDIYGASYSADRNCTEGSIHYLSANEDVRSSGMDPWTHYAGFGKKEGRKWYCFEAPSRAGKTKVAPFDNVPQRWFKQ